MTPVAVTQISAARLQVDWTPVRDTLAALRAGHESLDLFVGQLFSSLESTRERLSQHEHRLKEERQRIADDRERLQSERVEWEHSRTELAQQAGGGEASQRLVELEQERSALEDELETVRRRCEELADTVAEQKRQIAEERAEWTAEFRQLRKILDKQSQILAQRVEQNHIPSLTVIPAAPVAATNDGAIDPVLGSVMSQFQLLQKDAARRRAQHAKNKAS